MIDLGTGLFLGLIGAAIGFVAGLLGIGGGIVLVPILFFFWAQKGISPEVLVQLSFGTSLMVAALTSVSSALGHLRKGQVVQRAVLPLASSSVFGALLGSTVASNLPGDFLKSLFAVLLCFASMRMFLFHLAEPSGSPVLNPFMLLSLGLVTGFLSSLLGIGGGLFSIPIMIFLLRFPVKKVAGTSSSVMVFTATAGMMGYVLNGLGSSGLPQNSLGYINWAVAIPVVGGSLAFAQLGALANQRANVALLRKVFGGFLLAVALKILAG